MSILLLFLLSITHLTVQLEMLMISKINIVFPDPPPKPDGFWLDMSLLTFDRNLWLFISMEVPY